MTTAAAPVPDQSSGSVAVPLGARPVWWISFLVVAALGSVWAFSTPLMGVPDEPAHTVRAVAVADGQLRGRDVRVVGDASGVDRLDSHFRVPTAYSALRAQACFAFSPTTPASCAAPLDGDMTPTDAVSYTGTYPPLFYALVGWPSRLLAPQRALYAMRLCSVVLSAAFLASALASIRTVVPRGPGVAALALALTPTVFFLVGSVNPNGLEIAAAVATWASLLDLARRRGPAPGRLVARVVVATVCFAAARPLSPVFAVLVLAAVLAAAADRSRVSELAHDRRARLGALVITLGLAASAAWVVWANALDSFAGAPQPWLTFGTAVRHAVDLEPWRTRQMFGVFGWLDVAVPWGIVLPWLVVVGLLLVAGLATGTWRQRAVLLGWLAVCVVLPLAAEGMSASRVGLAWQGRYTMPLAVGLPILSAWALVSSGRVGRRALLLPSLAVVVAMAVAQLLAHGIALTRYVVAVPGRGAFAYLSGTGWAPPLGTTGLFVLAALASAAYGAWLAALALD